ncbi:HesB/YadR/YfhF family protein [Virgibacillus kimchii]
MNLDVSQEAAQWYISELELSEASYLRFFVRYGFGGHIPGFSLGVKQDTPTDIFASASLEGVTFFIENKDAWYFEDNDLHVSFNSKMQEPEFEYVEK